MSFFILVIKFKSIKIVVVAEMPASAYTGQGQTVMLLSPEGDAFRNGQFFTFFYSGQGVLLGTTDAVLNFHSWRFIVKWFSFQLQCDTL